MALQRDQQVGPLHPVSALVAFGHLQVAAQRQQAVQPAEGGRQLTSPGQHHGLGAQAVRVEPRRHTRQQGLDLVVGSHGRLEPPALQQLRDVDDQQRAARLHQVVTVDQRLQSLARMRRAGGFAEVAMVRHDDEPPPRLHLG